ncbi:hypothetical protein D3C71_1587390 [compost metagenome]
MQAIAEVAPLQLLEDRGLRQSGTSRDPRVDQGPQFVDAPPHPFNAEMLRLGQGPMAGERRREQRAQQAGLFAQLAGQERQGQHAGRVDFVLHRQAYVSAHAGLPLRDDPDHAADDFPDRVAGQLSARRGDQEVGIAPGQSQRVADALDLGALAGLFRARRRVVQRQELIDLRIGLAAGGA